MEMETLPSGTILHGRYRIERALGSGGFGHVYLSVDTQTNSQYALKEYLVTGAGGQAQLSHEARVLSQLHHPNLPAFQEAFNERGRYFVVLGYIDGNDLTDYIRVVRLRNEVVPLDRILTWILSISDAVQFLHSQKPPVIHRDIKPDNIRIKPDGTAILVDLGNAKAIADGSRTLFFIRHQGTPGYAPIEQYPGGSGTDARSDVYALGGTLFFALTAHEPPSVSTRNSSIAQGRSDLPSLQEQVTNNPPEASAQANAERQFRSAASKSAKPLRHSRHLAQLAALPPELLNRLDRIIKRAMAMKPDERYQSVADFSNDLRSVLVELPTEVKPPARPKDPNSTQPDLPVLYEEMQAAKGKIDPTTADASAASALRCPHCNAELLRQALYCPHCGSKLTNVSRPNPPTTPSSPPDPSTTNPQSTSKVPDSNTPLNRPKADISGGHVPGRTSATYPRRSGPVATFLPATAKNNTSLPTNSSTKDSTSNSTQSPTTPKRPTPPLEQSIPPKGSSVPPGKISPLSNSSTSSSTKTSEGLIILAVVLVLILLIVALFVLFAASKSHHFLYVQPGSTLASLQIQIIPYA